MSTTGARVTGPVRWLIVAGWLTVVPLAAVALARLVVWDSRSVLVALTPSRRLYLPVWPVAVLAGVLRRWALLAVAVLVIGGHLVFALPEMLASEPVADAARSAPTLRIFDANVYEANLDVTAYADEIRRARPDLVVLQESTPELLARLEATGVLAGLPHRITVARTDPAAAACCLAGPSPRMTW